MRIIFAGTPDFAAVALQALADAGHEIPLVLTQPDRPSGRGMKLTPSPVKVLAQKLGIEVATPFTLSLKKDPDGAAAMHARLKSLNADLLVVAAYGLILPLPVLDCAKGIGKFGDIKALNIHASLLPRWRGAAPIARAIEAGDAETGVTLMKMELGLDTGPMVAEARTPILAEDTTATLTERLASMGANLLVQSLQHANELICTPQPDEGVLYAEKLLKSEKRIQWSDSASVIARRLRAFTPFPATAEDADTGLSGEVLSIEHDLVVRCGVGALRITELQRPGKTRSSAQAAVQGLHLQKGEVLQ